MVLILVISLITCFGHCCSQLSTESKCTGCPPMYNGKPCASTTRYTVTGSACGCFDEWARNLYTVAPNEKFMVNSRDGSTWCADRCGECLKLTTTGGWVVDMAEPNPTSEVSITVMITNVCPISGNVEWCGQSKGFLECLRDEDCESHTNEYGYNVHFDIRNNFGQIYPTGLNWDNVEVTFERVNCPPQVPCSAPGAPGQPNWESCDCNGNEWDPTQEIDMCEDCNGEGWCNDLLEPPEYFCGNLTCTSETNTCSSQQVECPVTDAGYNSWNWVSSILYMYFFVF